MSVLLCDMEIPKENPRTINIYRDGTWVDAYTTEDGRATELSPHGRLIDADALTSVLETLKGKSGNPVIWDQMIDIVKDIHTVIEAEEKV